MRLFGLFCQRVARIGVWPERGSKTLARIVSSSKIRIPFVHAKIAVLTRSHAQFPSPIVKRQAASTVATANSNSGKRELVSCRRPVHAKIAVLEDFTRWFLQLHLAASLH